MAVQAALIDDKKRVITLILSLWSRDKKLLILSDRDVRVIVILTKKEAKQC